MSAISLARPLILETRVQVPDGMGGWTEDWVSRGTLWAEVRSGPGRESAVQEATAVEVPLRITVRGAPVGAPSRPAPGDRLRDGSRSFRIVSVAERDSAGRYLTCHAREELPA